MKEVIGVVLVICIAVTMVILASVAWYSTGYEHGQRAAADHKFYYRVVDFPDHTRHWLYDATPTSRPFGG